MSSTATNGSTPNGNGLYSSFEKELQELIKRSSYDKDLLDELRKIYQYINRQEVNMMFAGFMKAGKSTSVNTLLGRDLLPTKFAIPETGALCFIRSDDKDTATVTYQDGVSRSIPCTKEAIREESTLQLANGQRRVAVNAVDQINLTLDNIPIPNGVVWIDSPGIGDDDQVEENAVMMTKRTKDGLKHADILIWIWNTKNPFSMFERDFVADYVETHGPLALLSLLNCHLSVYNQTWPDFIKEDLPALEDRMISFSQETGLVDSSLEIYSASDRSVEGKDMIKKVRSSILDYTDRFHPRIQSTRFFRAYTDLQKLGEIYLTEYNKSYQILNHEMTYQRQSLSDEETQQRKANKHSFKTRLKAKIQEYRLTVIEKRIDANVRAYWRENPITENNLIRSDGYTKKMGELLESFEKNIASELADLIINDLNYLDFDTTKFTKNQIQNAIVAKTKSPYSAISVADTPIDYTAAVVGGILGTIVSLGIGTGVGIGAGRILAETQKKKKDVLATNQSITNAIQWSIGYYQDKLNELVDFIESNYLKEKPSTIEVQLAKLFQTDLEEAAYLKDMGGRLSSLSNIAKSYSEVVR